MCVPYFGTVVKLRTLKVLKTSSWTPFQMPRVGKDGPQSQLNELWALKHQKTKNLITIRKSITKKILQISHVRCDVITVVSFLCITAKTICPYNRPASNSTVQEAVVGKMVRTQQKVVCIMCEESILTTDSSITPCNVFSLQWKKIILDIAINSSWPHKCFCLRMSQTIQQVALCKCITWYILYLMVHLCLWMWHGSYLSDKVNMTLSFLYRRRTIRWYPVFSVGMTLLRCICHSWHNPHLKNILLILEQSSNFKILKTKYDLFIIKHFLRWAIIIIESVNIHTNTNCKNLCLHTNSYSFTYLRNMLSVFPMVTPLSEMVEIVSTPSNTRTAFSFSL